MTVNRFGGKLALLAGALVLLLGGAQIAGAWEAESPPPHSLSIPVADAPSSQSSPIVGLMPDAQSPADEDENCIACHSDAERLQELAVEEEEENLSSGPG